MVKVPGLGTLRIDLKSLREAAGLKQDELAERSGVGQGSISKLEQNNGKAVMRVALATLVRLSHGLGLDSPMAMFTWEPGPRYAKHR
jgi:transcriptional regulator with XRE-family HTH domain